MNDTIYFFVDKLKKIAKSIFHTVPPAFNKFPQFILGWIYDHQYDGSVISRERYRYKLHRNDKISRKVFIFGCYSKKEREILLRASSSVQSFIDIGANIGTITVPVAHSMKKPALAIEPVSANFSLLVENIDLNSLSSKVNAVQVALGDRPSEHEMVIFESNMGRSRLSWVGDEVKNSEVVRVETLDTCLNRYPDIKPPYLLKIDVEGNEHKILAGAQRLLKEPCIIFLEFRPFGLSNSGSSISEFEKMRRANSLVVIEARKGQNGLILKEAHSLQEIAERLPGKRACNIFMSNIPLAQTGLAEYFE